ncbi:NACHT domain-containing protein, partial [bacterium]|nr:NACHT domain-containing protein [bacterium]
MGLIHKDHAKRLVNAAFKQHGARAIVEVKRAQDNEWARAVADWLEADTGTLNPRLAHSMLVRHPGVRDALVADGWAEDEPHAKTLLRTWPSPMTVALCLDSRSDQESPAMPLRDLRRSHMRVMAAVLNRLAGGEMTAHNELIAVAHSLRGRRNRSNPATFLNGDWDSSGGPATIWFLAYDNLIEALGRRAGQVLPGPWAQMVHPRTAVGLWETFSAAVDEHLDAVIAETSRLPFAWHAPHLHTGGREPFGDVPEDTFIRRIRLAADDSEHGWDEWVTIGNGADTPAVLVVADPGFGKTTLTQWEAASRATEAQASGGYARAQVPILVTCKELDAAVRGDFRPGWRRLIGGHHGDLVTAVSDIVGGELAEWMVSHPDRCCLIADALDEVPGNSEQLVESLCDTQGFGKVIVTTRPVAPTSRLLRNGYTEVRLAPLSPPDVLALVDAWFHERPGDAQQAKAALAASKSLSSLARIPLFATLLCTITDPSRHTPGSRVYAAHRLDHT